MIGRIARSLARDEGIGIATALSVSFIVFILGATWYTLSVHELEEVASDRHRTRAINTAEAGAREMMYILASDKDAREAAKASAYTSGIAGGSTCDLQQVLTRDGGADVPVGEYWARATKVDPTDDADRRYLIESWGWAPEHTLRQHDLKKISIEIELVPFGGGFYYALFAGQDGLAGANSKTIYGDIYSGKDLTISNSTTVLPNDPGWDGVGDVLVYGNMYVSGGSNNEFSGTVRVNGFVEDQKRYTQYKGDVVLLHLDPAGRFPLGNSKFTDPTVAGTMSAPVRPDGVTVGTGRGKVHELTVGASTVDPVPSIQLPSFVWNPAHYRSAKVWSGATAAKDFNDWLAANADSVGSTFNAHLIEADLTGPRLIDLGGFRLAEDFVIVANGSVEITGVPEAVDLTGDPVTLTVVVNDPDGELFLNGQLKMNAANNVHLLAYSKGTIAAGNLTKLYGAVYSDSDVSGNQLEVHFRPPNDATIGGFKFDPTLADLFVPQPGVWRETPTDFPVALSTYCNP